MGYLSIFGRSDWGVNELGGEIGWVNGEGVGRVGKTSIDCSGGIKESDDELDCAVHHYMSQ